MSGHSNAAASTIAGLRDLSLGVQAILRGSLSNSTFNVCRWHGRVYVTGIAEITPDNAAAILRDNFIVNRKITESSVIEIGDAILRNCYDLNGEPIIFDDLAYLRDGHHRLTACSRYGAIRTFFTIGVSSSALATCDQGHVRTVADILSMRKYCRPHVLSSCLSIVAGFLYDGRIRRITNSSVNSSRDNLLKLFSKHQTAIQLASAYAADVGSTHSSRMGGLGNLAALHFIFSAVDQIMARHFLDGVARAEGFPVAMEGKRDRWQPARVLLGTLAKYMAMDPRPGHEQIACVCVKTWNKVMREEQFRTQSVKYAAEEAFPLVEGWEYDDSGERVMPIAPPSVLMPGDVTNDAGEMTNGDVEKKE